MKTMPSAIELRGLCSLDAFVEDVILNAQRGAKFGDKSHSVEVPESMSIPIVKERLAKEFPGCKIWGRWFTRHIEIAWA